MFNTGIEITPAQDLMRALRIKVAAIQDEIRAAIKGPIQQDVQNFVDRRLGQEAEQPKHPFAFATLGSRGWYFLAMRKGLFDSQTWDDAGGQWQRTGTLPKGWVVELDPRTTRVDTIMTISNQALDEKGDEYSQAVYGPMAVPGHDETGWGAIVDDTIDDIVDLVESELQDALDQALSNF